MRYCMNIVCVCVCVLCSPISHISVCRGFHDMLCFRFCQYVITVKFIQSNDAEFFVCTSLWTFRDNVFLQYAIALPVFELIFKLAASMFPCESKLKVMKGKVADIQKPFTTCNKGHSIQRRRNKRRRRRWKRERQVGGEDYMDATH